MEANNIFVRRKLVWVWIWVCGVVMVWLMGWDGFVGLQPIGGPPYDRAFCHRWDVIETSIPIDLYCHIASEPPACA